MNEISAGTDTLVFDGGPVKALGDGKFGGYGVLFTTENDPDLQREFFTKATEFELEGRSSVPVYWHHGLDPSLKGTKLSRATFRVDDAGIWFETKLEERDAYEKAVKKLGDLGKLGWSTGATSHLVQKKAIGSATELLAWPVGEISLDHRPVEPRTFAMSVKSLNDEFDLAGFVKSIETPFDIQGVPSIKEFCEAVSPNSLKDGSQRSDTAQKAVEDYITITNVLGEAFHSYTSRLVRRTENRFIKANDTLDSGTIMQANQLLAEMDRALPAFGSIKEALQGIQRIGELSKAEQKALSERARLSLMSYCRISGTTLEEMEDNGRSTS